MSNLTIEQYNTEIKNALKNIENQLNNNVINEMVMYFSNFVNSYHGIYQTMLNNNLIKAYNYAGDIQISSFEIPEHLINLKTDANEISILLIEAFSYYIHLIDYINTTGILRNGVHIKPNNAKQIDETLNFINWSNLNSHSQDAPTQLIASLQTKLKKYHNIDNTTRLLFIHNIESCIRYISALKIIFQNIVLYTKEQYKLDVRFYYISETVKKTSIEKFIYQLKTTIKKTDKQFPIIEPYLREIYREELTDIGVSIKKDIIEQLQMDIPMPSIENNKPQEDSTLILINLVKEMVYILIQSSNSISTGIKIINYNFELREIPITLKQSIILWFKRLFHIPVKKTGIYIIPFIHLTTKKETKETIVVASLIESLSKKQIELTKAGNIINTISIENITDIIKHVDKYSKYIYYNLYYFKNLDIFFKKEKKSNSKKKIMKSKGLQVCILELETLIAKFYDIKTEFDMLWTIYLTENIHKKQ